jgi:hypothetical protein
MRLRQAAALSLLIASGAVVLGAPACAIDNAIVGGNCATGYTDCNNVCVLLSSDPDNCGSCGHACAAGVCINGMCGSHADAQADSSSDAKMMMAHDGSHHDVVAHDAPTHRDGRLPDGELPDGEKRDGEGRDGRSPVDAPTSDGRQTDGHVSDAHVADVEAGPICTPPFDTVSSCGACNAACNADMVCSPNPDGGTYYCVDLCTLPLIDCGGTCVDEQTDPLNCGMCGMVCPSGLCLLGDCVGITAGDIVAIGHDYASTPVRSSEARLLSNAVFLPPTNPLRILSYEQYAIASQVTNAKSVLTQSAQSSGRTIQFTVVTSSTLIPTDVMSGSYDVLLIYDQGNAPAGSLATIGASWQSSLQAFVDTGGDVVVLDGASGANPEMATLMSSAGLLDTTTEVPIAQNTQLLVKAPADAVGTFVLSPYAAQTSSVSFVVAGAPDAGTMVYVVDESTDAGLVPVVIHRTP